MSPQRLVNLARYWAVMATIIGLNVGLLVWLVALIWEVVR